MKKKKKTKNINLETTLTQLQENIAELSPKERAQQEVADKIYTTLKGIVDKKNEKAHLYQADFNRRLTKRINDKGKTHLLEKYFGTSDPKEVIKKIFDEKNQDIYKEYKKAEKELEKKEYNNIFEIFKRAYNKKLGMHKGNDIDKKAIEFLLKKSGFFFDKKERKNIFPKKIEVNHGQSIDRWMTVDSWGTVTGMKIEGIEKNIKGKIHKTLIGSKLILDEHGDKSKKAKIIHRPTSSTHIIHTLLRSLKKIPPQERQQIQRFVNFVDIADSMEYQTWWIDYKNLHKTVFGLHHQLPIEEIYAYFKNPKNTWFELLSDKELEKRTIKKMTRKWQETKTRKQLSDSHKKRLEENQKKYTKISGRGLMLNNTRYTVTFDDELLYPAQVGAYYQNGICKIGINKETKQPYLYIFNPFEEFTQPIAGIIPEWHFIHKENIDKKTLKEVIKVFSTTNDYIFTKEDKNQTEKDMIAYIEKNTPLPELDVKKLKIGQIMTWIINNVNKGKVFIKLGKNISGVLPVDNEEDSMPKWKKIKVQITKITQKEENKFHIELKQVA